MQETRQALGFGNSSPACEEQVGRWRRRLNRHAKAPTGVNVIAPGLHLQTHRHTDDDDEGQNCQSPALTFVERLIKALRMTVRAEILSEEAWILAKLEAMLEDTPGLVHRRRKALGNEADLQEIMHDYLSACFPDFRLNPPIGGTIKNFKPDCGIASVGAAIEFKLAHTKQQAIVSFTGVVEDTGGYKGSKDWTRFYAVMYQAKPFILKSHLRSDMKRIGASTWKAVLVNGDTKPKTGKKQPSTRKKVV